MTLLLLACVPHHAPTLGPPALDVRAALAAPDPAALTEWRATVAQIGPFELVPGRRTFSPEPTQPFDTFVVSDGGAVVRVMDDSFPIRVIVGVQREDLANRVVDRVALAGDPTRIGAPPPEARSELAGGTQAVVEGTGWAVRVTWQDDGLMVGGWVPRTALGVVWRYAPFDVDVKPDLAVVDPLLGDGPPPTLDLYDAPDGTVIGVARSGWALLRARGADEGGWRLVEARTAAARVVGWALSSAVAPSEEYGYVYGSGGGTGGMSDVSWIELGAGSWIRVDGETQPFARATQDTRVVLGADLGATVRVRFSSAWGWLDGVVDCSQRAEGGEGSQGRGFPSPPSGGGGSQGRGFPSPPSGGGGSQGIAFRCSP